MLIRILISIWNMICKKCGESKPINDFRGYKQRVSGKLAYRRTCRKCENQKVIQYVKNHIYIRVHSGARRSDRLKGWVCELSQDDIKQLLLQPCAYCGAQDMPMSIDRYDNSIGHTKTNTVPCCLRCNCIKMDMPHAAWELIRPAVRLAFEQGLFNNWVAHSKYRAKSSERKRRM